MKKCQFDHCSNESEFFDSDSNYVCEECMNEDLENDYSGQSAEDYERLNWDYYPKNGYSE